MTIHLPWLKLKGFLEMFLVHCWLIVATCGKWEAFLRKFKGKEDIFDYRIATNSNGVAQGVVWQNSFMRANFKLFGETIFLDFVAVLLVVVLIVFVLGFVGRYYCCC